MKKILTTIMILLSLTAAAKTKIGENIDVNHYEIHLNNIDFNNHTIEAVTTVTLTAKTTLTAINLELKTMSVSAVTSDDANVSGFSQNGDLLTIDLATTLTAGATASFTISYGGNTYNDGWGGILWTSGYVCNMGVGFETIPHNLGKTWFPCIDNFTDKATYEIYVTVPNELQAICGGLLESDTDNGNGTHTVHYVVNQEIATYHISFVAGDYVTWNDVYNGLEHDIPINVNVKPSQYDKIEGTFVNINEIASYLENCFGPYPFNRIGYSITSVGCMEHIDNIGITNGVLTGNTTQESYLAHELSHMWFGNKITCASAEEMWLNEGFAQFCGMNYKEILYGEEAYREEMDALIESVTKNCHKSEGWLTLNNVPQNFTYGTTVYSKGATVVHTMRNYLGKERFNEAMRYYLDKFAFQSVTSEELRDAITESTGIDMTGFFDSWVFTCGAPHYAIDLVNTTPNGSRYDVEVFTSQKHRHSDHIGMGVILELAFMDNDWNIATDTIHWDGATGHTTKTIDFQPIAVFCDYYNKYADARTDYNFIVKTTGKKSATYLDAIISEISDSTFLHIENHWVGPDHNLNNSWEMKFSEERYYSVFRDDKGEAVINGEFKYTQNFDPDLIQSENDSVVLLYRENASIPWHSIPYEFQGNWKLGKMTVENLISGDYTFASIDKTHLGFSEKTVDNEKKLIISPNPADEYIRVSVSDKSRESMIYITTATGQTIKSFPVEATMTIPTNDLSAGVYYIILSERGKRIVASEKFIIK